MIDLYRSKFEAGVLDNLCRQVRKDVKKYGRRYKKYCPKGICAGGKVIPLREMDRSYPVVFLLYLVLNE